ncbi:shikimate kinase [Paenibacillus sp. GSMTC-2017]|uniref:shikimate kinase n=1 Tax=Paenibacillus sp. GSMTC-2017 TaxID=2794350 RepID=UPI0018D9BB8C|nr:shikimate kinase [Paenibacillus sp. GSMTC-2017]MBH5316807.1 shikimate kinase [Paenibacillus sp. GSMTC-2017]
MESKISYKLILIGFMGTGKSSVSRLLAEQLGCARIDVDEEIERSENKKISAIFEIDGEEGFREIESRVLQRLLTTSEVSVIATGGGAVLRDSNRQDMLDNGYVVALKASPDQIVSRVMNDESRPLLNGDVHSRVSSLLEQRKTAYDFAHCTIDTTELTVEDVVSKIVSQWNHYSSSK